MKLPLFVLVDEYGNCRGVFSSTHNALSVAAESEQECSIITVNELDVDVHPEDMLKTTIYR